jgi:crossover junction endodeoxyribonuclease RuvC
VGQASGIALVVAARRGLRVAEYSPNETKIAVTGDGSADKQAVQTMVARLLRLERVPSPADAADALALAITHCVRDRHASTATRNPAGSGFRRAVEAALERVGGTR